MNSYYYMLEQVWLAHKEAGLETLVEIQFAALAVLTVVWVVGWAWAGAKAIVAMRKRLSHHRSTSGFDAAAKPLLHVNEMRA